MLRRHPLLLAEWLALRNLLVRARGHALMVAAAGTAVVGALALLLLTLHSAFPAVFAWLLTYRVLTLVVVCACSALAVSRARRVAETRYEQFWLAAAPVKQYSRTLAILAIAVLPIALQLLAVCALLAAMALVADVDLGRAGELMLWITGATAVGAVAGWWSARRSRTHAREGSRYVRHVKPRKDTVPSVAALSSWPLAQVRAWGRPDNLRILLMAAMLGVQAGSSALVGLSVVAIWLLGGYLAGLLTAVLQTASMASRWLRSTPIPFAQFAWAVTRRALLYQVAGAAAAVVLMVVLGSPLLNALYLGALWLATVVLACSIRLAECYRARSSPVRLVVSFAALAAVETREQGWSIAIAAVLAAWHLRAGTKT